MGVPGAACRRIGSHRGEAGPGQRTHPRTGLVLGAGGVVGAAWMTGALQAVQDRLPGPLGDVDLIVGTSAGSVLAAALRCGVTIDADDRPAARRAGARAARRRRARPRRRPAAPAPAAAGRLTPADADHAADPAPAASRGGGQRLAAPRPGPARGAAGHGRGAGSGGPAGRPARAAAAWADGRTWIVAVDYDTGQRVIFGRAGAPRCRTAPTPWSLPAPSRAGTRRWSSAAAATWTAASGRPPRCATLAGPGSARCTCSRPMASTRAGPPGPARRAAGTPAAPADHPVAAARGRRCCAPGASGSRCSPRARRTWPRWAST